MEVIPGGLWTFIIPFRDSAIWQNYDLGPSVDAEFKSFKILSASSSESSITKRILGMCFIFSSFLRILWMNLEAELSP
tara:strand:+ start:333 stop:566 length:234 start_codon:yes stop_codon:yes gene_type:complete